MSCERVAGTLVPSLQHYGISGLSCRGFLLPRSLDCAYAVPGATPRRTAFVPSRQKLPGGNGDASQSFPVQRAVRIRDPARTKISTSIPSLFERYLAPAGLAPAKPATPRAPGYVIPAQRRVVGVMHETRAGARVGASRAPRWCSGGVDGFPDPGGTLLRGSGSNAGRTIALSGKCFN